MTREEQGTGAGEPPGAPVLHVIEKSPSLPARLRRIFTPLGYCIRSSRSRDAGLARVAREPPDILILGPSLETEDLDSITAWFHQHPDLGKVLLLLFTGTEQGGNISPEILKDLSDLIVLPSSGGEIRMRVTRALTRRDRGSVTHLNPVLQDIFSTRAQAIWSHSVTGICTIGSSGLIRDANPAFSSLSGCQATRLAGMPFVSLIYPPDREDLRERLEELIAGTEISISSRTRFLRPDGSTLWTATTFSRIGDTTNPWIIAFSEEIELMIEQERVLRESEEKYRAIVEQIDEIMYISVDGKIAFYNQHASQYLGYSHEEIQDHCILDFVHPDDRAYVDHVLTVMLRDGTPVLPFDARILTRSGEVRYCEITSTPIQYKGKQATMGVVRDVTSHRKAERGLLESERKFHRLVENSWDIIYSVDRDGYITYISPRIRRYGYEPMAALGKNFLDFCAPEDRQSAKEHFSQAMEQGVVHTSQYRLVPRSGAPRWFEDNSDLLLGEDGIVTGLTGVLRDITDRMQMEEALRDKEVNFRTFFNTIDDFVLVLDTGGKILEMNATVTDRLGYDPTDLVGKSILAIHPKERRQETEKILADIMSGEATTCRVPLVTCDGREIPAESRLVRGIWSGVAVLFCISKDISDITRSEEKFSRVFAASTALMSITTFAEGRYIEVNEAFLSALGFSRHEVIGRTTSDLHIYSSTSARETILSQLRIHGITKDLVMAMKTATGEDRYMSYSGAVIELDDIPCIISVIIDITERIRAEEALRQSETHFREILQNIEDAYYRTDTEGRLAMASPSFYRLLGYEPGDELIGTPVSSFWENPDDRKKMLHLISMQGGVHDYEVVLKRKNGSNITISATSRLLYQTGGDKQAESCPGSFAVEGILRDISRRKEYERIIQESEKKFRDLFDNAGDAILILDERGVILEANMVATSMYRVPHRTLVGSKVRSIVSEEARPLVPSQLARLREQGSGSFESIHQRTDHSEFPVDISTRSIDYLGQPALLTHIRDITERKHLEEALASEHEYSLRIIRETPAIVAGISASGATVFINPAGEEITGYSSGVLVEEPFWETLFHEDQLEVANSVVSRLSSGPVRDQELVLTRQDGTTRTVLWNFISYPSRLDLAYEIIGIGFDITARKEAEETGRQRGREILTLLDSLPGYAFFKDIRGAYITANESFCRFAGTSREGITGKTDSDLFPAEIATKFSAGDDSVLQRGAPWFEKEIEIGGETQSRTLWMRDVPIQDTEGSVTGLIGLVTDITYRKEAERDLLRYAANIEKQNAELILLREELSRSNEQLEEKVNARTREVERLLKQKDQFISQLGHDLKTPLTPLLGLLPYLQKISTDTEVRDLLGVCIENSSSMKNLVKKTLQMAKYSSLSIPPNQEPVAITEIAEEVIHHYQYTCSQKGIICENRIPGHCIAVGDRILLSALLDNLIGNAIKYMKDDGGRILLDGFCSGDVITISVMDTGIGIAEDEIGQIFTEFYMADPSRHSRDSHGLGLSICRRIIDLHNGRIWAESPGPGLGSTFHFSLPAYRKERH